MGISVGMVKWSMQISEFNIKFHPLKDIKAQERADFITEFTFSMPAGMPIEVAKSTTQKPKMSMYPSSRHNFIGPFTPIGQ